MKKDEIIQMILNRREMMKAEQAKDGEFISDQIAGLPQPPLANTGRGMTISLTKEFDSVIKNNDFLQLLNSRVSRRKYSNDALTLEELSFLLWSTQGVKEVIGKQRKATLRTVPSAGARHPFETYLFINRVEGLEQGLYHYLALDHQLEFLGTMDSQEDKVSVAFGEQTFFGHAAVDFVWTVVPYRSEWRYSTFAQKYALIDVGHVCQNLYLACEAIGCGTCAVGAYEQEMADQLLGLETKPSTEPDDEFVVYAASVGKLE